MTLHGYLNDSGTYYCEVEMGATIIKSTEIVVDIYGELCHRHKQPSEVLYKKDVLKILANFTGKHLRWNLSKITYYFMHFSSANLSSNPIIQALDQYAKYQKQLPEVLCEKRCLATLLKRDSSTGLFLWNLWNSWNFLKKTPFLKNIYQRLLLEYVQI